MNIHEETLKIARNLIKKDPSLTDWVISKFPELKEDEESRNEMIKGAAIEFVRQNKSFNSCLGIRKEQVIDWLEKQGKQTYVKWSYDEGKQIQINPSEYINDMGGNGCYLKNTAQASAWSEEDEKMSRFIGNAITTNGASIYLKSKGIQVIDAHVWLNGLKERYTWKPSDEQMEALWSATEKDLESDNENVRKLSGEVLESLYKDLKKLKG